MSNERDELAAKFLAGFCANPELFSYHNSANMDPVHPNLNLHHLTAVAFRLADTFLCAREVRHE